MDLNIKKVEVWAATVKDEPGALKAMLDTLADAGANLDLVISRRSPEEPGSGAVFLTPLRSDDEITAAKKLGFNRAKSVHSVRIEGPNKAGATAEITGILADAGINIKGFSAAVLQARFMLYIGLDSAEDAEKAVKLLNDA